MPRKTLLLPLALALLGWAAPAPAQQLGKGWWIVVGSFPIEPWQRQKTDFDKMHMAAAPCHVRIFNDLSGKFRGFTAGYNVFVIGAFTSQAAAKTELAAVKRCFAGAYIRYGEYLGE